MYESRKLTRLPVIFRQLRPKALLNETSFPKPSSLSVEETATLNGVTESDTTQVHANYVTSGQDGLTPCRADIREVGAGRNVEATIIRSIEVLRVPHPVFLPARISLGHGPNFNGGV